MHIAPTTSVKPNAVTNQDHNQPPAKAALALLATRTDMADEPFGKLVSLFARGQDIPSAPSDQNTGLAADSNTGDATNTGGAYVRNGDCTQI